MTDQIPQFSVHAADVIAAVMCHCRFGNNPILIMSTQIESICKHCLSAYGIIAVNYDMAKGGNVAVNIGRREQKPKGQSRNGDVATFRR